LNDANRILCKRSEIALAKHSKNSHFSHLYVKLIYTEQKKFDWHELILLMSYCWQRKKIPKKFGKHHRV